MLCKGAIPSLWGFHGLNAPALFTSYIDVYIYTGRRILAALRHLQLEILPEAQRSALSPY